MTRTRRLGAVAVMLVAAMSPLNCRKKTEQARVEISGTTWRVEVAMTGAQRERGLSYRRRLAEDEGMLFMYPDAAVRSFWMRECFIPLDIAFIGPDMRVIHTCTMEVETDLQAWRDGGRSYSSMGPAQYALETPAGTLAKAGVSVGDRVRFLGDIPSATKAEGEP